MDEKNDQGMVRGSLPDGGKDQEGKDRGVFQKNGFEHFAFNPSQVITWGILSGIIGLIVSTLSVYQRLNSTIDERIQNNRELNKTLITHEKDIEDLDKRQTKTEAQYENLKDLVTAKKNR